MAALGNTSGQISGIKTGNSRMNPLVMNVTTIQDLVLVLILPPDSNVESSNMASLGSYASLPQIGLCKVKKTLKLFIADGLIRAGALT
jgi:hypothetical protein